MHTDFNVERKYNSNMQKIAELFHQLGIKLRRNRGFAAKFYGSFAALVVVIILIPVLVSCGKNDAEDTEDDTQMEETAEESGVNIPDYTVKDVPMEENAHADVNDLVNRYFAAMTTGDTATLQAMQNDFQQKDLLKIEKESAYIDEFDSIKVYTKPGPLNGSYVTFVYYEIKFTGIDTLAPGLTTLYICPNEDGSLYINSMLSEQDTQYFKAIVDQQDVVDLFSLVETKYAEAVDADANLKSFMEGLSAKLDAEVSEAMAALEAAENGEGEPAAEETAPETTENVVAEKVKAIDTVNVRSSDSENADRLGQIAMGDTITRYESKENGWSRVDYNGQEGYIKSEYLEPVEQAQTETPASTENTENTESASESTQSTDSTPTQTGSLVGKSKITIKETVNVRASASQEADKLGLAYQGENYDLIQEQADGWCKIKYNGKTGYVKTEFVE